METLKLTPEYTYITAKLSDISVVSYPRVFYWYCDGDPFDQQFIGQGDTTSSLTTSCTGLDEGTEYTIECIVENDNTGATVAVFQDSATTKEHPPTDPVVMGGCSVSPSRIRSGDEIEVSWDYTGDASTSSYFDVYASNTTSFSDATIVRSVHPPRTATPYGDTWSKGGTWYFWVVYRGNSSRSSRSGALHVAGWVSATAYVYHNGHWVRADSKIHHSGWKTYAPHIYLEE